MTTTFKDPRFNRNHCAAEYMEFCKEYINEKLGINKDMSKSGHTMSWDNFKTRAYATNEDKTQVDCLIDFNANTITLTTK